MRLKEIKPNTAIHCTSKEQIRCLIDAGIVSESYAEFDVPIWIGFYGDGTHGWMPDVHSKGIKGKDYYKKHGLCCVEFSYLIIPDMSAEEVMEWFGEYYIDSPVIEEVFGEDYSMSELLEAYTPKEICDHISDWKADHDKKEPEIETVDICRIIEVLPDGRKRCVHEEDLASGSTDAEIKILVEAELKRYCMEHDGEFIAVHEVVSRVKAVE